MASALNRILESDDAFAKLRGSFDRVVFLRQSGFSNVLRAYETEKKRDVAIKIVKYNAFRQSNIPTWLLSHVVYEAQQAACHTFQNVVNLYHVCIGKAAIVFVMEYCADSDLERILRDSPPYVSDESYVESFIMQMITAAIEMTRAGLCCRTIGTENILIQRHAKNPFPMFKISDLGMTKHLVCIASWAAEGSFRTSERVGEESEMSPSLYHHQQCSSSTEGQISDNDATDLLLYSPSPVSSVSPPSGGSLFLSHQYQHHAQIITPSYIAALGGIAMRMLSPVSAPNAPPQHESTNRQVSMEDIAQRMLDAGDVGDDQSPSRVTLLHVMEWMCIGRGLHFVPAIWTEYMQERSLLLQNPWFPRGKWSSTLGSPTMRFMPGPLTTGQTLSSEPNKTELVEGLTDLSHTLLRNLIDAIDNQDADANQIVDNVLPSNCTVKMHCTSSMWQNIIKSSLNE
jgi:serine/threonine protein kinase